MVLGAPVGRKKEFADISLLVYLAETPQQIQIEFVDVYFMHRGQQSSEKDTITFRGARSNTYLHELADLIESVAGASVKASRHSVVISAEAARQFEKLTTTD